jgi:hypothetical protein
MELTWKTIATKDGDITIPEHIEMTLKDGQTVGLQKITVTRVIETIQRDLGLDNAIYLHAAGSPDGLLWYVTLIHPREKLLIVPPAALITNMKYPGAGSMMQKVFEQIARRDSLNLMVSIAPKSDTWYQPQVQQTLSAEGYYLAPPGQTRQYWVHKLSYKGNGIPQMWIPHESMKPPLQMWD